MTFSKFSGSLKNYLDVVRNVSDEWPSILPCISYILLTSLFNLNLPICHFRVPTFASVKPTGLISSVVRQIWMGMLEFYIWFKQLKIWCGSNNMAIPIRIMSVSWKLYIVGFSKNGKTWKIYRMKWLMIVSHTPETPDINLLLPATII